MPNVDVVKPSGLEELNDDVLGLILAEIYREDRPSIRLISRVSKRLYRVSLPWQYRNVCVTLKSPQSITSMRRHLASESELPSFIRELRIEGHHEDNRLQEFVLKLISRISRLENFSWDEYAGDTPTAILESVIAKWPNIRLTIDSELGSI
ncbi:uncharacterized protein BDZ99DRAFT_577225 [Mytilinidion resinicola]|uniref:F-box domain-containing protein n=1 Tax=Mytilinidion resinicola TaxID=574789 RepID=A0A6A6Y032_9PEZI|nr:uncharacterized protein BDZ99DRAFT_577225 [Mytilinidion resinicola]KAF2802010.1 hypothetical protein BDZ99DRAFT_577225 [Mytilinidion resinicola]